MLVKSYRVALKPQNKHVRVSDGQPVAKFPNGPTIGKVQNYDPQTGEGVVVLTVPVHYSELEEMGIGWDAFLDCE